MKATTVKEVLVAAKWLLNKYQWCRGSWYKDSLKEGYYNPDKFLTGTKQLSCMCLDGAVKIVDADGYTKEQARDLLNSLLKTDSIVVWNDIAVWNDAPKRTKKQVLALLNKAIDKALGI